MKSVVADYRYKTYCLRIVPQWGDPVYITSNVSDLTMNGHVYKTDSGYEFSGLASEDNMSPGIMDLSGVAGIAGIDRDEIVSGVFDGARVYAFATTWRTPVEDEEPLGVAILGKTTMKDDRYVIEMMMLVDALNQSVGKTYTAGCQKPFGGQEFAGCKVDLGPITVTGTLTSVTSNSVFRDNLRTEAPDYFGEGTIAFTTGDNAGLKPMEIKEYVGVKSSSITAITKAASAVVTVGTHTFIVGDVVTFSGVVGMTQINGLTGTVTAIAATTITVNIASTSFGTYSSGGTVATLAGTIKTHESFHYPVAVGDEYVLVPGCRKRLEDCRDKWSNIPNFGGFSFIPTQSTYTQIGSGG
jgi:uncharacterized phage protein (TIGR02218 family)